MKISTEIRLSREGGCKGGREGAREGRRKGSKQEAHERYQERWKERWMDGARQENKCQKLLLFSSHNTKLVLL
jgi:hypothetical protein